MKTVVLSAALLLGATQVAQAADTSDLLFATSSLYLQPTQTIDFLSAVWLVVASGHADDFYPVDINGLTFTTSDADDENDPISLTKMPDVN